MAKIKISQLTAKGSSLANTDLLPIAEVSGLAYVTKRVTGAQVGVGGSVTLTVGTTAIASGTIGRVFFQGTGNVLQQSANLFWDNTNNRLGIGTASPTTAIDVNGTIRVDNTSFTGNAFTIQKTANGTFRIGNTPSTSDFIQFGSTNTISLNANTISISNSINIGAQVVANISNSTGLLINNTSTIQSNLVRTGLTLQNQTWRNDGAGGNSTINAVKITPTVDMSLGTTTGTVLLLDPIINTTGGTHTIRGLYYNPTLTSTTGVTHRAIETTTGNVIFNSTSGNVAIGGTSFGSSSDKVFAQYTGIAPGSSPADAFQMYSADIVGGNAAPHFRTENGNIVKIYQETTGVASATFVQNSGTRVDEVSTFDGYTIPQVVKALRNLGILA